MKKKNKTTKKQSNNVFNLVDSFFNDQEKTLIWFLTINPLLGNMTPLSMLVVGRYNKLIDFIKTALDENTQS